jgi:hypothetical protein
MPTINNDGHALDDKGNVQVDFVWGNFPQQPNDNRTNQTVFSLATEPVTAASGNGITVTYTCANAYTVGQVVSITGLPTAALNLTAVPIASLIGTAGAATGFTVTSSAVGATITALTASSPTTGYVTYTANNTFSAGQTVTVTGITSAMGYNAPNGAKITAATPTTFTIANATTGGTPGFGTSSVANLSGATITSSNATVSPVASNLDFTASNHYRSMTEYNGFPSYAPNTLGTYGADVYGNVTTPYVKVPNVVGKTKANAISTLVNDGYTSSSITTLTAAPNTPISYTTVSRTAGSYDATITATGVVALCPVGTQIVITVATGSLLAGTYTVKSVTSTNQVTFTTTANTALSSGTGTVAGVSGTVQLQSVSPVLTANVTAASTGSGAYTFTAANSFASGQPVNLSGFYNEQYNLIGATIASATATQFTVSGFAISAATVGTTTTTFTTSANHNFVAGNLVTISGVTTATAFNATFTITAVTSNSFTVATPATGTTAGGTFSSALVVVASPAVTYANPLNPTIGVATNSSNSITLSAAQTAGAITITPFA